MWPHKLLPLAVTLLLLAGCQTGKQGAATLERFQAAADPRVAVQIPVT